MARPKDEPEGKRQLDTTSKKQCHCAAEGQYKQEGQATGTWLEEGERGHWQEEDLAAEPQAAIPGVRICG